MVDSRLDPVHAQSCSFCGRPEAEAGSLIAGAEALICEHCIGRCMNLVDGQERQANLGEALRGLPTPRDIHQALDDYVVGQAQAKKVLGVATYNHYKRLLLSGWGESGVAKSNILLVGPTGSGKTLLAETLARVVQVPFVSVDATSFTEAGYVGEDVESMLQRLLQACDFDVDQAQRGIIYIDEIDKLAGRGPGASHGRDVPGEGVQQALLKLMEGTIATVPLKAGRRQDQADTVQLNTREILFIVGGAFAGIDEVKRRRRETGGIGFTQVQDAVSADTALEAEDLREYGLIPELIGRLPVVAELARLQVADLLRILDEPKNAVLKQFGALLDMDGVALHVTPGAKRAIAEEALRRKSGARGLRAVVESLMLEPMFHAPTESGLERITIHAGCLRGQRPRYLYQEAMRQAAS